MTAMLPRVPPMINPTLLRQLTEQRQREVVSARSRSLGPPRRGVRERLGWSLVGLGANLALGSRYRTAEQWHRFLSEERVRCLQAVARP
jgi:predicted alpha/beta hydrolase